MTRKTSRPGLLDRSCLSVSVLLMLFWSTTNAPSLAERETQSQPFRWGQFSKIIKDRDNLSPKEQKQELERQQNRKKYNAEHSLSEDTYTKYSLDQLLSGVDWKLICPAGAATLKVERCPFTDPKAMRGFSDLASCLDARKIQINHPTARISDIAFVQTLDTEVRNKSNARLSFRCSSPTSNTIHILLKDKKRGQTIWQDSLKLFPEEQEYDKSFALPPFSSGDCTLSFELGTSPGLTSLSCLSLRLDDPDPAVQRLDQETRKWFTASYTNLLKFTPAEINGRIKRLRQGVLTIAVVDKAHKPVPKARVEVTMLRHYFPFGCNFNGLKPEDHSLAQRNYQGRFAEVFNYAKLPCYWNEVESKPGKRDFSKIESMAKWCGANNIIPIAYDLVSPFHIPAWASKDYHAAIGQLRATVIDSIDHLSNLIKHWDVVDGALLAQFCSKDNLMEQWLQQDKLAGVAGRALVWAHAANSKNKLTLIVNELFTTTHYPNLYANLRQQSNLPDVIGLALPMQNKQLSIDDIWHVCSNVETFDKDLYLMDLAVVSAEPRPKAAFTTTYSDWHSTSNGETKQADFVDKLYRALFSNRNVSGIFWRDFSDRGAFMGAPDGLLRADGTPKPAYNRLANLIRKEWWTNSSSLCDQKGITTTVAFFGDYKVTVRDDKGHITRGTLSFTPSTQLEIRTITIDNSI
jgi:endo-1,4-beta-xylanase